MKKLRGRRLLPVLALVGAGCGARGGSIGPTDVPLGLDASGASIADVPAVDAPAVDTPAADTPLADASVVDVPTVDAPVVDTPVADVPTSDVPALDVPALDVSALDVPIVDVPGVDTTDLGPPDDAPPACEMAPSTTTTSSVALTGLTGAVDFAFDGRGGVAVAVGASVILRNGVDARTVTMTTGGEVVALRYTRTHGLFFATATRADAGPPGGAIYQLPPSATTPVLRQGSLRSPGGLAVDADDAVWFSDTAADTVYRLPPESAARAVVADVPSPTLLLIDAAGRYLFVAQSAANKVVRIDLRAGDGGSVGRATDFVVGLGSVAGLAQDECEHVYVADGVLGRVFRAPLDPSLAIVRLLNVSSPRGLAFGAGGPYSARSFYTLSTSGGTLREANAVVLGVPFPVPR